MSRMEVALALLTDYANVTREGKLNLLGLFNRINAPTLPWTHPQMQLALSFEASPAEYDTTKNVQIKLLDADGNTKFAISSDLKVPREKSGRSVSINTIIAINNLRLDTEGDYAFHILIGGDDKKSIPLRVDYVPKPQPGPR